MDTMEFETTLKKDGYEANTKSVEPGVRNDAHSHPFDVRALMLAGELTLTWDGQTRTFRPGEVFTMAAGCSHAEQFGPEGATYLVGRRAAG